MAALPGFFNIFLSHFSSESMMIPASYYDELPLVLPKTALIQGSGGCFWKVAMTKKRDEVYFGQGWAQFVEDNRLRDGDILTFAYDGYRKFKASIYGSGGSKEARAVGQVIAIDDKEDSSVCHLSSEDTNISSEPEMGKTVPSTTNKGKEKAVEDPDESFTCSEDSNNSDSSDSPPNQANSRKKGKSKSIKSVAGSASYSSNSVTRKKQSTIKNPEAYLDDPKNIHFETIVKNRIFELLVHAQLVKDYCLKFQDYVYYIDNHVDGKLKAKISIWNGQRVFIKRWSQICKRNGWRKGDRFVCELFRKGDLVYAIKIHPVTT